MSRKASMRSGPRGQEDMYFIEDNDLTEGERSYCRCVLHVEAKNTPTCSRERAWFEEREGRKCYNPFAVCTKSTGNQSRCSNYYNFDNIPDDELTHYALVRGLEVPYPYDREALMDLISAYVCDRGNAWNNPICKRITDVTFEQEPEYEAFQRGEYGDLM